MRGPPKRNGPAGGGNLTPGHDRSLVKVRDRSAAYPEMVEVSTAAEGAQIIPFRAHGGTVRAICIVPDSDGLCRSVLSGRRLHHDLDLAFAGPLWHVKMMVKDYRQGLPVHVHPECERRAGL